MATLIAKTDKKYHQFRSNFQEIQVDSSEEGATILMYACQQENEEQLRLILKKKPEAIKERDRTLKTVLHYCAENMASNCAELVLDDAPDLLDMTDEDGYTTLHLAVIAGNLMLVNYLISKSADVNKLDAEGHSVIHWATVCGETDLLQILLKHGANPSTPDVHGGYPVHYAAQMCGTVSEIGNDIQLGLDVLRTLLNYRVNVDVTDHDGRQPLLWAASAGSSDAVLALINGGASIQARDKDGLSALHCAASRGHTDCIETLIKLCGANVNLVDNNGCSALFYCVTLGHADATQLLLQCGANPNLQDRKGRTPAHCGAAKGQFETLRILKKYNGNLWIRNIRGDYCLHEAVNAGRKELVKWLLSQRPDAVNASNIDGRCPLHIATSANNIEMCKILLDYQAIINSVMRTNKGDLMTPLDTALHKSNRGCAKYLQLHGGVPANKLSSHSAALRGLRRIEPHSDYHGFSDSKLEIPFQTRSSRSLDTSPCEHRIIKSGKVQVGTLEGNKIQPVRIKADISSTNVGETNIYNDGIKCTYKKTKWENSKPYNEEDTNLCKLKSSVTKNKKYMRNQTVRTCYSSSSAESDFSDVYDYSSEDEKQTKKKLRQRRRHKKKQNNGSDTKHSVHKKNANANYVVSSTKLEIKDEAPNMSLTSLTEVTKKVEPEKNADCTKNQHKVTALVHRENESETKESVKSESSDSGSKVIKYQKLDDDKMTDDADANTISTTNVDIESTIFKCDENAADGQIQNRPNDDELTRKYVIDSGKMDQFGEEVLSTAFVNSPQFDYQQRDSAENLQTDGILPSYEYVDQDDSPNADTSDIRDVQQNLNSLTTERTESSNVFEQIIDDEEDAKNMAQSQVAITKYSTEVDEAIRPDMEQLNEAIKHGCQLSLSEMRANDLFVVNTNESIFNELKSDVDKSNQLKLEQNHNDSIVRARPGKNDSSSERPKSKGLICVILDDDEPSEIKQRNEVMMASKNTLNKANVVRQKNEKKSTSKQHRRFGSSFQILPSDNMKHSFALTLHDSNINQISSSNCEELSSRNIIRKTPRATSSNGEEQDKERDFDENISSITRAVQNSLRKYHLERRIFHTLLELKRLQIRAGKSNEQILIKRLIDDYQKAGVIVGLRQYDGIYSFRHFERYLYEQLRTLQSANRKDIPKIKSTDDFEKLKKTLRRTRAGKTILESVPNNPLFCTFGTHRCIHATHAYTGIPCAAYIAKMDHHLMPKYIDERYQCFLPRIDHNKRTQCKQPNEIVKSLKNVDPSKPVTLELIHGAEKQIISLPTEKLDKNKRYYVTFTIKGANNADEKFSSDVEKEFVDASIEKKIH